MNKFILILIPIILLSCASSGIRAPETVEEKINFSAATLTGLTHAVTDNLKAGLISVEDAEAFYEHALVARQTIAMARLNLTGGNETDAITELRQLNLMLLELNQTYNKYGGTQ